MPKKQTTAARKARAAQRATGGKYTALLAGQTCGDPIHPFDDMGSCARPPHPADEPCSLKRDWDPTEWRQREAARWAEAEARWAAMTPEQRQEAEEEARAAEYDDGHTATEEWEDIRSYKWED